MSDDEFPPRCEHATDEVQWAGLRDRVEKA